MDGWTELQRARWPQARAAFEAALAAEETAAAHEGLSWAAWWLDDGPAVIAARERAHALYIGTPADRVNLPQRAPRHRVGGSRPYGRV